MHIAILGKYSQNTQTLILYEPLDRPFVNPSYCFRLTKIELTKMPHVFVDK